MIDEFFIEKMLTKAGFKDDDNMEFLIDEVRPVLYDWVMTHIAEQFGEEQFKTFNALIEKKADDTTIYEYLKNTIPNYETFIQKVYNEFETMYLEEFKIFEKEFSPDQQKDK